MGCTVSRHIQSGNTNSNYNIKNNENIKKDTILYIKDPGLFTDNPLPDGLLLTSKSLNNLRNNFWFANEKATYVGDIETWKIIKSTCQLLLDGDIKLANTTIEAAGIKTTNYELSLCYDSKGNEYQIPRYCYCRPKNLMPENEKIDNIQDTSMNHHSPEDINDKNICLRLSNTGKDVILSISHKSTVMDVKRKLQYYLIMKKKDVSGDIEIPIDLPPVRQRYFYQGKQLNNNDYIPDKLLTDIDTLNIKKKMQPIQVFILPPLK